MSELQDYEVEDRARQLYESEPIKVWPAFDDLPLLEQEHYLQLARRQLRMRR